MEPEQSLPPGKLDELLDALADRQCRSVLSYFRDSAEDVASLMEVAEAISTNSRGDAEETSHRLHHVVLPRLAAIGAVDYDARSKTIRYRGHAALEALMDGIAAVSGSDDRRDVS